MLFSLICLPVGISARKCLPVTVSGCLLLYLSACAHVYLYRCMPVTMPACLQIFLSTRLPFSVSACVPVNLSACLHTCLNTYFSLHVSPENLFSVFWSPSFYMSACLHVYLSKCLPFYSGLSALSEKTFNRRVSILKCLFRIKMRL